MRSQRYFSREFLLVLIPALLLAGGALWLAFKYVKPAPPQTFVIAAASKGSPYFQLATRYSDIIAKEGIKMEVRETAGSFDNLKRITDPGSDVQAALIQGGIANKDKAPNTFSAGRLLTEPVWVFYRGDKIDQLSQLQGKRVLVGPSGSGTNFLARKLLEAHGVTEANATFIEMELPAYIETFKTGGADAGFLVLGAEARTVQALLRLADVKLMNMAQADGLTQRYPFLTKVTLHRGVADFAATLPPEDTTLVATQAALLVRDDLHPALVTLLAQAILQVQRQPQLNDKGEARLFTIPSETLNADDPEFLSSSEAHMVYKSGPTFLQRVLPFWVANLLNRVFVLILPLLGIILPLIRLVPIIYNWRMKQRILNWYKELKNLEQGLPDALDADALRRKDAELDRIEEGVQKIQVPIQYTADLYNLRDHVDFVRRRLLHLKASRGIPVSA
jgi:TRAP transporter TAXI family solute receptor